MRSAAEIMGMAWPVVALTLVRRISAQVAPKPPREAFNPRNPAHVEAADDTYIRMVKGAAEKLGVAIVSTPTEYTERVPDPRHPNDREKDRVLTKTGDAWMSLLTVPDWKKICFGLSEAIDPECTNCPHWPQGWRDAYERARHG